MNRINGLFEAWELWALIAGGHTDTLYYYGIPFFCYLIAGYNGKETIVMTHERIERDCE